MLARLLPLVGGQLCLHASMAGVRLAAPLMALATGHSALAVGVLLALFAAAPVLLALPAGRMTDRHGYHRPLRLAVLACTAGGLLAASATLLGAVAADACLGLAAVCTGAGANLGLIAIQRSAGRLADGATELKQVFSWLGLAPALSNLAGPVLAGVLIDQAGYGWAFVALAALPLGALACARMVPLRAAGGARAEAMPGGSAVAGPPRPVRSAPAWRRRAGALRPRSGGPRSWDLLASVPLRRLLVVNWVLSSSWDVHSFAVPLLGHERGLSASAIGLVLGSFALAVTLVRLAIAWLARHLREGVVLKAAMLWAATVLAVYPLVQGPAGMVLCAVLLGLALGAVQPMIMSTLHLITPDARHGEVIALRSMAINASSALMPLGFGTLSAGLGAPSLFWVMSVLLLAATGAAPRTARG